MALGFLYQQLIFDQSATGHFIHRMPSQARAATQTPYQNIHAKGKLPECIITAHTGKNITATLVSGFHQGPIYFSCYKIAVKAEENDERDIDRKIFLQVSLVIFFIPCIILDQRFIRKEGALNKQTII